MNVNLTAKSKTNVSCLTAFAAMTLRLANQAQLNCNVRVNALLCSPPSFICLGSPATLSVCIGEGEQLSNLGASTYHIYRHVLIVSSVIPMSDTFLFSLHYILANPPPLPMRTSFVHAQKLARLDAPAP